jgi:two-component system, OmpR family, response regulator
MRILIIEDEHHIARLLKEGLGNEGFAVDVCNDGEDGMAAAQSEEYDLIVLDRMLPGGKDGADICRTLRSEGNHIPIIMLTAKDKIEDRVAGLNAGADDYLVKPFSFLELLARVHALLRRPHEAFGETLSAGDLSLNTATKKVQRGGEPIRLSATEYALLEYLLRNKGRVVSKNTLINHVWDFDANVLPSTVEVHIVYLRAKIEKPFDAPKLVHTVRGFGYEVIDPATP